MTNGRPALVPPLLAWSISAGEAAAAMNGRLVAGDPGTPLFRFSIDSRTLAPGAVFFAIRGDRFDGHAFVPAALVAGAAGVVASEAVESGAAILIRVTDTTRALQALARHVRRTSGATVVAVTGSTGKTTTKEAAADFLAARYRVFRNAGNLNNHIGLPLSLLSLLDRPEVAVVELGMSHAGEIRTLVGIAEPDVRVWTNVAEVHTAFFDSLEAVADAKAEVLEGAGPAGTVIANADDPLVVARVGVFPGRVVTFGFGEAAVTVTDLEDLGLGGAGGTLVTPGGGAPFHSPLVGVVNVANVLAAAATAWALGVPAREIAERICRIRPAPHRGQVVPLAGGITLLDDSYNSNPRALRAMLGVVGAIGGRRRVGVLGEMLELGPASIDWHRACGRAAALALDVVVAVGGEGARAMADAAAATMAPGAVLRAEASGGAADLVAALVRPGDVVLVKGSRGVRTELVVDRLRAERPSRPTPAEP